MAIIKCKMCGGELILIDGASTAECEFCGSVQTIPNLDDEKTEGAMLFLREAGKEYQILYFTCSSSRC